MSAKRHSSEMKLNYQVEMVIRHLLAWGLRNRDQGLKEVLSLCQQMLVTQPCTRQSWGTAAHQTLPSMGFSRQEYWSGVPLPSPGGAFLAAVKNDLF